MSLNLRNILLLSSLLLSGCASAPEIQKPDDEPGKLGIMAHRCDEFGVAALQIVVTKPGIYTMSWSNKGVCGYPT